MQAFDVHACERVAAQGPRTLPAMTLSCPCSAERQRTEECRAEALDEGQEIFLAFSAGATLVSGVLALLLL